MTGIDPFTVLLLHMDGANGDKGFPDSSRGPNSPHVVNQINGVVTDTSQKVFGQSSGKFVAASSQYLLIPDSADWLWTGDFTVDWRVQFASLPASNARDTLWGQDVDGSHFGQFNLFNNAGTYQWEYWNFNGALVIQLQKNAISPVINTWYHLVLVRSGNNWYIFQDGTQCGTTVSNSATLVDYAIPFAIGSDNALSRFHNGWLDEFRVSKGIARWRSNFTPPTSPYSLGPAITRNPIGF